MWLSQVEGLEDMCVCVCEWGYKFGGTWINIEDGAQAMGSVWRAPSWLLCRHGCIIQMQLVLNWIWSLSLSPSLFDLLSQFNFNLICLSLSFRLPTVLFVLALHTNMLISLPKHTHSLCVCVQRTKIHETLSLNNKMRQRGDNQRERERARDCRALWSML